MKKIAIILVSSVLVLSLLSGCEGPLEKLLAEPTASELASEVSAMATDIDATEPEESDSADADDGSVSEPLQPATNASEGYTNYLTIKGDAYDRVITASETSTDLSSIVVMNFLGVSVIDLQLIAVTMFSDDLSSSEMAMAMLGMKDAKITGTGNDFAVTYLDADGALIKQTCTYDVSKDQLTATLYDGSGKVAIFFEYIHTDDAYIAQYYKPTEEGYQVLTSYFDTENVAAFGIYTMDTVPAPIAGQNGLNEDFVVNDTSYLILKDGKLTIYEKGTTTTN